jgi:hypothetical protein
MKPVFNHYYMFKITQPENKFLDLICKSGCYETFEERKKRITTLTNIQIGKIYCYHPGVNELRLLNPFHGEMIALAQSDNNLDTIVVVYNYSTPLIEFFISEKTGKGSFAILELVKSYELVDEMILLRKKAKSSLLLSNG